MMVALNGQPTRFEKAKQGLSELLSGLTRRDEVILLTSTTVDSQPITTGPRDAVSQLRSLQAKGGPVDLGKLTEAAVTAAEQCSNAQRTVIVASDFQNCNVGRGTTATLSRLNERIEQNDLKPAISFWSFAETTDEVSNLSVDAVEVDSPAIVAGRNAQFSARVRNASDNPERDLRVVWSIDGVALAPRLLSVDARAGATTRLSHRMDAPGAHEITVSIEHGDAMAEDNRRTMAVDVMREIKVVLVDGKPSSKPLQGQADFLAIALSPFCLLYTSPSPRDLSTSRMPSSA